jgi:hypothetical protein
LLDLNRKLVEVYRDPGEAGYAEKRTLGAGDELTLEALPGMTLGYREIFSDTEH